MKPQYRSFVQRVMTQAPKLLTRTTRLFETFEGNVTKMSQYLIYEAHHGPERVNSKIHYGPVVGKDGKLQYTVRKNGKRIKMYGREHIHHTLSFTFTD